MNTSAALANTITTSATESSNGTLAELSVARIRRNTKIDPRLSRNAAKYKDILESIRLLNVNQPILVRPITDDAEHDYEIVAGNTRWQCCVDLGKPTIPSLIRELSDSEARMLAAVENIQRADLTPIEEAKHVLLLLEDQSNDHDSVCSLLGWSRSRLNSRILLSHCNPDVAEALVQDKIKIGHAELLAGLPSEMQSSILEKIIERNMTVVDARQRLASLTRDLSTAKFDTKDCHGCPKNSATHHDLFSTSLEGSKCGDAQCWTAKAEALIEVKLIDAKAEYGVVHTDLTLPADAYATLASNGSNGVGESQLAACSGCEHFGAVVSTVVGNEGEVRGGLCFNKKCNSDMQGKYQESLRAVAAPAPESATTPVGSAIADKTSNAVATPTKKPTTEKPTVAVIRKSVRRHAFDLYAKMGQKAILDSRLLALSVAITSLYFDLKRDLPAETIDYLTKQMKFPANKRADDRHELEMLLAQRSVEDLDLLLQKLASVTVYRSDSTDWFEKSVRGKQSLAFIKHSGLQVKDFFVVNEDYLKTLTKAGVIEELKASGFEQKYTEVLGDKAFKTLITMKADELVKAVVSFSDFDWSGYVPAPMTIEAQSAGTLANA